MNTIEYRNVVQIGLHATAEMIYLAEDNWHQQLPEIAEVDRIVAPKSHEHIQYHYYGIDDQPWSITGLQEQYQHIERAKWMCIRAEYPSRICEQYELPKNKRNFVGSFTLDQIFDCVCNDSGIDAIDILKLDIEGAEINVLQHYSFQRKPRLLMVEIHFFDHENAGEIVKQIVEPHGYQQIRHIPTNFHANKSQGDTIEMHFQTEK